MEYEFTPKVQCELLGLECIPNWQDKWLFCHVCGALRSVKYRVSMAIADDRYTINACNKCALRLIQIKEKKEKLV